MLENPSALMIPISHVRSVTVTSMIFIIPIEPTRREIRATVTRKLFRLSEMVKKYWLSSSSSNLLIVETGTKIDTSRLTPPPTIVISGFLI